MIREDLEISVERITVKYLFHNLSAKPVDAVVAFPLPALEGGTVEHVPLKLPSAGRDNFVDFRVWAAGVPIPTKAEIRAWHEGREITARVQAAGLPVSVIDENFQAAIKRLAPDKRAELEKSELLVSDDVGEPANPDRRYWPYWDTKVTYYWTQHFPAGATVQIRHEYRPVVGGSLITLSDPGDERVKPYCGGADAVKRIRDYKLKHPEHPPDEPVFTEKQIRYILTTAKNWRGPIGEFHLGVTTSGADDIVLTCMQGLRKVGPRRYELVRRQFSPSAELDIQILQVNP
jgi:hypothetical protein